MCDSGSAWKEEIRELTPNLKTFGLDIFNDLYGSLGNVRHVFSMAMFAKETRRADDNV